MKTEEMTELKSSMNVLVEVEMEAKSERKEKWKKKNLKSTNYLHMLFWTLFTFFFLIYIKKIILNQTWENHFPLPLVLFYNQIKLKIFNLWSLGKIYRDITTTQEEIIHKYNMK